MRASDGSIIHDGVSYYSVDIPTNDSFLRQWHLWIHKMVANNFKRNRERMMDTVQNVRLRLLQKDFVGRWFFKHLTDELVDRSEAERILGGVKLKFISQVSPVVGDRSDPDSLWMIRDLLAYAKFDHSRYYYSIQDHTVDSVTVLGLLGYGADSFGVLESLYRQGRLKPAELTEHECVLKTRTIPDPVHDDDGNRLCSVSGCGRRHYSRGYCSRHYSQYVVKSCPGCERGRRALHAKGISLARRWTDPEIVGVVRKLRWNDTQLRPFLREWRGQNAVKTTPLRVYRPVVEPVTVGKRSVCVVDKCKKKHFRHGYCDQHFGVTAGLLKYAKMLIVNAAINDFKSMSRTDDVQFGVFNNGMSPEMSDLETVAWESDDIDDTPKKVFRDVNAQSGFDVVNAANDLSALFSAASLDLQEASVILRIDMKDQSVKECAASLDLTSQEVQRIRSCAMRKLKMASIGDDEIEYAAQQACTIHGCTMHEMLGSRRFGKCVKARVDFLAALAGLGMTAAEIANRTPFSEGRVTNALALADIAL